MFEKFQIYLPNDYYICQKVTQVFIGELDEDLTLRIAKLYCNCNASQIITNTLVLNLQEF